MTSTVKLYYDTKILADRNMLIEHIEDYLSTLTPTVMEDFQYIKHDLSVMIKFDTSFLGLNVQASNILNPWKDGKINYVSIQNETDTKPIYYYVIDSEWIGKCTLKLYLAMDTLNTFNGAYSFDKKTVVTREHKDRFSQGAVVKNGVIYQPRKFYLDSDGIQPTLYKVGEQTITDDKANYDWYLMYMANNTTGAVEGKDYPINAYLVSDEAYKRTGVVYQLKVSDLDTTQDYWFGSTMTDSYDTNDAFVVGDKGYNVSAVTLLQWEIAPTGHWVLRKQKSTSSVMQNIQDLSTSDVLIFQSQKTIYRTARSNYSNVVGQTPGVTGANVVSQKTGTILPSSGTTASEISSIETVDRTDTRIIGIIKLPYCPVPVTITNDTITYPDYITENIVAWNNGSSYWYLQVGTNFLNGFENELAISKDNFFNTFYLSKNFITDAKRDDLEQSPLPVIHPRSTSFRR